MIVLAVGLMSSVLRLVLSGLRVALVDCRFLLRLDLSFAFGRILGNSVVDGLRVVLVVVLVICKFPLRPGCSVTSVSIRGPHVNGAVVDCSSVLLQFIWFII